MRFSLQAAFMHVILGIMFMFFLVVLTHHACSEIPNYEKSQALERANYLLSQNNPDLAHLDRQEVVDLLLIYLRENPESINRTRVYSKIGSIYAGYRNEKLGIMPDLDKAREYFLKAIEADPGYVDARKISAYVNLASLAPDRNQLVDEHIKLYKTLSNISDAQIRVSARKEAALVKELLLKEDGTTETRAIAIDSPAFNARVDQKVEYLRKLLPSMKKSAKINLIDHATRTSCPELSLGRIIEDLKEYPEVVTAAREKQNALAIKEGSLPSFRNER